MIKTKVEKGQAKYYCTECGEEQLILQKMFVPNFGAMIDHEKTLEMIESFVTKHQLCKPETVQLTIFKT